MKIYNILKNKILFQKYKIIKKIGKGSFGYVFKGINLQDNSEVAIKVEKKSSIYHLLEAECHFLSILKGYGIPEVKSFGYNYYFYYLVIELLGQNLVEISKTIKSFSLKDIIMIAIQALERIEFVHSKYIIHRDIKPENFLFGNNNTSLLYLIDFGMARKYKSSRTGKHVKYSLTGKLFGTFKFLSYNASRGVEQSRRDDLESLGYMLAYMRNGILPWKGLNLKGSNAKSNYYQSLDLKRFTPPENICKNLPQEFADYLRYCRNLGFEDDPDYNYLINLFKGLLIKMKENNDSKFSWNKKLMFFWNKKSKEKKKQYPNFYKRKESPQTRLYKALKSSNNSQEKERKEIELKAGFSFEENPDSHYREKSEKLFKINDNLDESEFNNDNISLNSKFAHYNMKLANVQDLGIIDEKNTKPKKKLINRFANLKEENKLYIFQSKNTNNLTDNNKRKINKENIKNKKNIKIIINQNLSNSINNISHNFTQIIKRKNNNLTELKSINKKIKINPKSINFIKYKIINKSPTNPKIKKGDLVLPKPNLYKSIFNNNQLKNCKNGLIKRIKISEYKPFYNEKEKSDILYNNKNNNSKYIKGSRNYSLFNINKELKKNLSNSENVIIIEKKKKLPYQYSLNNINRSNNIYNISNDIMNPNLGQSIKTMHKSGSFNVDNNEIKFGLKSSKNYEEKYGKNNIFKSTNGIKRYQYSPQIMINNSLEQLNDLNNNLKIIPVKKHIYILKGNKY